MNKLELSGAILNSSQDDTLSLDNPLRLKCCHSFLYSLFHRGQKLQLDDEMSQTLKDFFKKRYEIQDDQGFQRVWHELGERIWTPNMPVTLGTVRQIDQAFQQHFIYHGPGISPPPSSEKPMIHQVVHQTVKALLHGGSLTKELIEPRALKAVFVRKDPEFLNQMRLELQNELDHLADHLPTTSQEEFIWRAFLGNVLSLMPFTYPSDNEKIAIPLLSQDGSCQRVEYRIQGIPLSTSESPIKALGLTPEEGEEAPPILIYSGTTYPAGDGFAECILADFSPGLSVGDRLYLQGQPKIDEWMKGKKEVHVIGVSLGGALCLQTLRRHQESIGRIDAYNPPGLYPWDWKKEYNEGCEVNIYCQAGDSVSPMGAWPTGKKVGLYHVIAHQEGVVEGPLLSHARAFTGCEKVTVLKKNPEMENKSFARRVLTFLHVTLSPFAVFLPVCGVLKLIQLIHTITWLFQRTVGLLNICAKTSIAQIKKKRSFKIHS